MTVKKINYLQKAEDVIIVLTFVVMTLSAFLQVCNRNITKIPVTGFEELSKYCMIYMVLLGTEMGLRDGTQIAVTALQDKLKGRARLFILILIKAILIVFAAVMFYQYLVEENEAAEKKLIEAGVTIYDIDVEELQKAYKAQAEKEGFTFDPEWQAAVDEAIASVK
ncbi:MAG: TRAP transporter small permease subunit [[Clostridium] symbiosum]